MEDKTFELMARMNYKKNIIRRLKLKQIIIEQITK